MKIEFSSRALEDYRYWLSHQPAKAAKIRAILDNLLETPFAGLGKPEPLLFDLQGYWSRRIDKENRLVYVVKGDRIIIATCRFHYAK